MSEGLVVIVRGLVAFLTLLILARFLGKQQVSQLTFFEYISGITLGTIAGSLTIDLNNAPWSQWIGLLTWAVATFSLQWIGIKSRYADKYLRGEPTVVIMNGQIMEEAMRKLRYRMDDLTTQLRDKNIFDLTQVEFAVLEPDGKLSVLRKSQYLPVTPKDLNIQTPYIGISTELIYDGIVIEENLQHVGLGKAWLYAELKKQGINEPTEVFLANLDTKGELYVDTYKDRVKNITDMSDYKGAN